MPDQCAMVLQICTDLQGVVPRPSSGTLMTYDNGGNEVISVKVEEGGNVKEE